MDPKPRPSAKKTCVAACRHTCTSAQISNCIAETKVKELFISLSLLYTEPDVLSADTLG